MEMENGEVFKEWLGRVMLQRPKGNIYLDSERGIEVARMSIDFERQNFSWCRGDEDSFWIDVQLCVKYHLSDKDILFMLSHQVGCENWQKHSAERNAYAEMMRGLNKLRDINRKNEQNV